MGVSDVKWSTLPDSPGYSISSDGRVRSPLGRILNGSDKDGYVRVYTGKKLERMHRLVAKAFVANPNGHSEVNHKDGNKKNNRAENLEWCSRRQNMQHAFSTGLQVIPGGEDHPTAKLTAEQVRFIRENYIPRHKDFGQCGLGRRFGVTNSAVHCALKQKNWRGV